MRAEFVIMFDNSDCKPVSDFVQDLLQNTIERGFKMLLLLLFPRIKIAQNPILETGEGGGGRYVYEHYKE